MRIEIHCPSTVRASEECLIRAVLFNDSYVPVDISRNAFIGPDVEDPSATGAPRPSSVEPTFGGPDQPLTLHPFSFYGRQRSFTGLSPGEITVTARYRGLQGEPEISATQRIHVQP
ncbi:MAG TPA: hypothetical protein VND93_29570 [Myxococcales bacterium]|jgi:hypothetical protein|nr:hypothetical protein [Myxococcales bacterium]